MPLILRAAVKPTPSIARAQASVSLSRSEDATLDEPLGGIVSVMSPILRAVVKPTPSIARAQQSVSLSRGKDAELAVRGRHDPCIAPRAVPCVEAALAIALLDAMLEGDRLD